MSPVKLNPAKVSTDMVLEALETEGGESRRNKGLATRIAHVLKLQWSAKVGERIDELLEELNSDEIVILTKQPSGRIIGASIIGYTEAPGKSAQASTKTTKVKKRRKHPTSSGFCLDPTADPRTRPQPKQNPDPLPWELDLIERLKGHNGSLVFGPEIGDMPEVLA